MPCHDLRDFINLLEKEGDLRRVDVPISPYLEITEVCDRVLQQAGPAILFSKPTGYDIPVLGNLFGTPRRVARGMGATDVSALRKIGETLAALKEPEPPSGWKSAFEKLPLLRQVLHMSPKIVKNALCQQMVREGNAVDLSALPIQHGWSGDVAPLITWGLTVTKGPFKARQNLGIYRLQWLPEKGKNKLIMRWLAHRGGALDFRDHSSVSPNENFPVSVIIGCDPATILAAVTPIPDTLSEYQFAGLLRGEKTELTACIGNDLQVPARAEIILEGHIAPDDTAVEGPFGDHTGYYNEQAVFPVFTVDRITMRENPIYLSTYTGRPPDEPAVLGLALNEVFVPLLQKQFPEIVDFYLPPEACSYRMAIVSIKKAYAGHAKRVMFGIWSFLRQFMYTKWIVVVDDDINIRDWKSVVWAMSTRMDAARDTLIIENTPIDYLDFASPVAGLGSKMGMDATNKWAGETPREWGRVIQKNPEISARIDAIWESLGL